MFIFAPQNYKQNSKSGYLFCLENEFLEITLINFDGIEIHKM